MNGNVSAPSGLVGGTLQAAKTKELPKVGEKLLLMWHPFGGISYEFVSGQSLAQEGRQLIEVEITSIKTAKVSFE